MLNKRIFQDERRALPWRFIIVGLVISGAIGITTGHLLAVRTVWQRHDEFLTRLNEAQVEQVIHGVERLQTDKEMQLAYEKVTPSGEFDYKSSLTVIGAYDLLIDKMFNQKSMVCDDSTGKFMRNRDFPQASKLRLLDEKTRQDVELIRSATQNLEKDGMCANNKATYSYNKWLVEANRAQAYALRLQQDNKDTDAKNKLLTFVEGKHVPADIGAIKKAFIDRYEDKINVTVFWFGAVYNYLTDPSKKNIESLNSMRTTFHQTYDDVDKLYKEKQKSQNKEDIKQLQTLLDATGRLNTGRSNTQYTTGLWADAILDSALLSYAFDHDGVYPKAGSIGELLKILVEGKYIKDAAPFTSLSYRSMTGYGYSQSVTTSTGKKYTFQRYVRAPTGQPKEPEAVADSSDQGSRNDDYTKVPADSRLIKKEFIAKVPGQSLAMKLTAEPYHTESNLEMIVYIDSPNVKLGTVKSIKDGSFSAQLNLPPGSTPGIRTVHIIAKTYSGEPVEFYQLIEIFSDGTYDIL
jgi:hypothetical protein